MRAALPPAARRAAAQETATLAALAGTGPAPAALPMPPMAMPDLSQLSPDLLGVLMPMFLWLDALGRVQAAGPTLRKVCGRALRPGVSLFDMFVITRPPRLTSMADLRAHGSGRLHLALRARPRTGLRGIAVPLGPGLEGGMLLNLSFGLTVADAVRDHALTDSDFAPTDLTVEMLYLIEAKSAVMGELRGMNLRLERAHRNAVAEALTDPLTGLANRRALELALEAAMQAGGRSEAVPPFALAHLDLDFFKQVNDTLGHAAGDAVLTEVARILKAETRKHDLVARVGGDEFVLVLRMMTDPAALEALGRRIIARLEAPVLVGSGAATISGSLGVVLSVDYADPAPERMLADADRALYASKHRGRAAVTILRPE
ncbi:diguanylate cyclase [Frigidibacter sp.]|uniref:GGDEF domain-containing protein n=1 Tax=Frigidibacter sp. TaxID=2586418 RepID=UPI0027350892|nr:GGDEF domain-containing protein [Frigidibacter sp.]MDP3342748.1 GGDEF domain-containing protein [Frigidibacter sp.]